MALATGRALRSHTWLPCWTLWVQLAPPSGMWGLRARGSCRGRSQGWLAGREGRERWSSAVPGPPLPSVLVPFHTDLKGPRSNRPAREPCTSEPCRVPGAPRPGFCLFRKSQNSRHSKKWGEDSERNAADPARDPRGCRRPGWGQPHGVSCPLRGRCDPPQRPQEGRGRGRDLGMGMEPTSASGPVSREATC